MATTSRQVPAQEASVCQAKVKIPRVSTLSAPSALTGNGRGVIVV